MGDPTAKVTASLNIVYRPVWPAVAPTLYSGETLTKPKNGLAAVRDQGLGIRDQAKSLFNVQNPAQRNSCRALWRARCASSARPAVS